MNLFRAIPLPLYQAPDTPVAGAADPPAPDPAVVANADPAGDPPPAPAPDPAASAEPPAAAPEADPKPVNNRGKAPPPKWALERIAEESEGKRREKERADNLQAMLDRIQNSNKDPAAETVHPPRGADDDVETRAQQLADERLSRQTIGGIISAGVSKYNDWDDRARTLAAVGAASPAFVLDVHSVDPNRAHEILHQLADDPDKAGRLAKMDTRTRIAELTRMSMSLNAPNPAPADPKPAPRQVSRAPAPPPPVEPVASQTIDWRSDKASDADFSRGWEEQQRQRALRGRR